MTLPDWGKMQFVEYPAKTWPDLLPDVVPNARDLAAQLIKYPANERLTAQQVLVADPPGHWFFTDRHKGSPPPLFGTTREQIISKLITQRERM